MFTESLLESGHMPSTNRVWTTSVSITVQAAGVALLSVLPILLPQAGPTLLRSALAVPILSPAEVVPITRHASGGGTGPAISHPIQIDGKLHPPTSIPGTISKADVDPGPMCLTGCGLSTGIGPTSGRDIGMNTVVPHVEGPSRIRASHLDAGALVHSVQPIYPEIAKRAGVQGDVVLVAVISRGGNIDSVEVQSGHPMLVRAAIQAVQQWKYRPYVLNGSVVEVETQITVHFTMERH
jgi:protein TonB